MQAFHPGFNALIKVGQTLLADEPDIAVAQTIDTMARYVREDRRHSWFQDLAGELRSTNADRTKENCFNWIKGRVRFLTDERIADQLHMDKAALGFSSIAEVLIRPVDIVRMVDPMGDCDDFSMLGACLLTACGLPCYFVTLAADSREPSQYSHVYVWAGCAFDSSHGPYVGWEAQNRFGKRQLWSVENGMPILARSGFGFHRGAGFNGLGQDDSTAPITFYPGTDTGIDTSTMSPGDAAALAAQAATLSQAAGIPTTVSSSGASSATPWWAGTVNSTISNALSILKARFAVPPPGTLIQTKSGLISTAPTSLVTSLLPTSASGVPSWIWLALVAVVALMLLKGGRR